MAGDGPRVGWCSSLVAEMALCRSHLAPRQQKPCAAAMRRDLLSLWISCEVGREGYNNTLQGISSRPDKYTSCSRPGSIISSEIH